MQCAELSWNELDLVLGQKSALLSNNADTNAHRPSTPRQRSTMAFYHGGVRICRVTFQKLHGIGKIIVQLLVILLIGKDRFMNLKASFLASGLTTRQHGNTRRLPKHGSKFDEVKDFVTFLTNYAEKTAILLPGRIPGYKQDDIQLLPSSTTKKVITRIQHTFQHMPLHVWL